MATTLTYGRVRPATGDSATVWMAGLEGNVTLDDAHTHNGTDSAFLPVASLNKSASTTIAAAEWSSDGGGNYSVSKDIPAGISGAATYNDVIYFNIVCKINTAGATYGDVVYPQIEREDSNTITIRVNDNTLDLILFYV